MDLLESGIPLSLSLLAKEKVARLLSPLHTFDPIEILLLSLEKTEREREFGVTSSSVYIYIYIDGE